MLIKQMKPTQCGRFRPWLTTALSNEWKATKLGCGSMHPQSNWYEFNIILYVIMGVSSPNSYFYGRERLHFVKGSKSSKEGAWRVATAHGIAPALVRYLLFYFIEELS